MCRLEWSNESFVRPYIDGEVVSERASGSLMPQSVAVIVDH